MFPEKYSVLVVGTPDAGIFEFCTYLTSFYLKNYQSVVLIEADTSATIVRRQLKSYGIRPEEQEGSYMTLIDCFSTPSTSEDQEIIGNPTDLPELMEQIKQAVETSIEPVRVIFDSLSPLHIHSTPAQVQQFLKRLSDVAKKKGSLTITLHKEMHTPEQFNKIVAACDGIIEMKVDERLRRYIRIREMKSLDIEPRWVPFEIEALASSEGAALVWKKSKDRY